MATLYIQPHYVRGKYKYRLSRDEEGKKQVMDRHGNIRQFPTREEAVEYARKKLKHSVTEVRPSPLPEEN
jgi:hypothetical protein